MAHEGVDYRVRRAAFEHLEALSEIYGDALPWRVLLRGFGFRGRRVPLLSQKGIFKPAVLPEIPLSIRTAPEKPGQPRPYDDHFFDDAQILYRYRGTDPGHRDNVGLRAAWKSRTPLIYFFGLAPGLYAAAWPVYISGDAPADLYFTVQVDTLSSLRIPADVVSEDTADARRAYHTSIVQKRLHQQGFRLRVLRAYREHCAVCHLHHAELLDAAHIIPDSDPRGQPVVPNGLSLCKLHHAAYDQQVLGIRPDLRIELREDLLREKDGPMLVHGLQQFQNREILVPRSTRQRPDPVRLERRYQQFRDAV